MAHDYARERFVTRVARSRRADGRRLYTDEEASGFADDIDAMIDSKLEARVKSIESRVREVERALAELKAP
jgi:hypothetical protein